MGQLYIPGRALERDSSLLAQPLPSCLTHLHNHSISQSLQYSGFQTMLWGTLWFLHVPQQSPGGEVSTFPRQLQLELLCIFFSIFWDDVNFFWPKGWNSRTLNNQEEWKPSLLFNLFYTWDNLKYPRKDLAAWIKTGLQISTPTCPVVPLPQQNVGQGESNLTLEWLLWPCHRPTRQYYNTGFKKLRGKPEENTVPNTHWEVSAICPPELFIIVWA